uniref:Uncharacterized protein n=1 Tax=Anguilla anguilla TaxID=7936 RepID=A0A0E9S3F7_ANGAN
MLKVSVSHMCMYVTGGLWVLILRSFQLSAVQSVDPPPSFPSEG